MLTTEYIILYAIFIVLWILIAEYYSRRYKNFLTSFLDSSNNISIITTPTKIININKKGLSFFGTESVKSFNASHYSVGSLFLEEDGCLGKHSLGKNWLKKIANSRDETIKVKLLSQENQEHYYFHIKVTRITGSNQYLVLFHNITKIEGEKKKIIKLAEHDALTGIYNRVKLNALFPHFIFAANKFSQQKFSIILFDIDHFKAINDTYGHNVGDSVLTELTYTVKNALREEDVFVRWGGEEFVVLLKTPSSIEDAYRLASRLRAHIEEHPFLHVGQVTCSFGVTQFRAGDTQIIILERVDEALYEAKENGRNQVVAK